MATMLLVAPLAVVTAFPSMASATTPTSVKLTAGTPSLPWGGTETLTAKVTPTPTSGSVTFTDLLSSGPNAGTTVDLNPAPINLTSGTAIFSGELPAFGTNTINAVYSGNSTFGGSTSATAPATTRAVSVTGYTSELIITQLRFSGPGGANDQYVEVYNTGPAVPMAGFRLTANSGASLTLPSGAPTLPTRGSYLLAGAAYSLAAVAVADDTAVGTLGSGGFKVIAPDAVGTVVDAVGSVAGFSSGTPLPTLSGTPSDNYAWVRIETDGVLANAPPDNASDFKLVSTSGGVVGGVQSTLGSPSPQATGSPVEDNNNLDNLSSDLLDPSVASSAAPNITYTPGTPGLLTVRRTLTNNGAVPITTAEARITSLSELNGLPEPDVADQPTRAAALRLVDPTTATSTVSAVGFGPVTVENLSVDPPATTIPGGGLATTLQIPLPVGGLAVGDSVNVAFTFDVDSGGTYWFGYDIDDLSGSPG